ncbi:phosphatidylglycerophosphatase A [Paracoccus solventivorans]|uniref:Phosphatidylglycerophosphatase A n=1 Tax=Paracoccus solventivorans TaxID=53463 RepID=A0A1M7H367_9RHOB|nr:phosphatidylglycerophosphatase A [Paracoccus solventivorans]SHM23055.1 phosphatidylglycerophosphatase A [Paracoccus solventivorans]
MDRLVATVFGIGYLRPAPGTWASAVTVALAVLAYECLSPWLVPAGFVVATLLGFWTVPRLLATISDRDPSWVVIDEVAGQLLALCFTVVPLACHGVSILDAWPGYVVPFLLFRLFDIWKPWLVGRADRRGDATGLMLDDILAGLFAGLGSVMLAGLYHAVLEPML